MRAATRHESLRARIAVPVAALLVAGCATFSQDGGFPSVQALTRERAPGELAWARSDADADALRKRVAELLARPLTVDDAVQVALLNNPGLQARYAELGIAEADLVQAGRLRNPRLSYLRATHGDEIKVETALVFNVLAIFTLPLATRIEEHRFEQVKLDVAADVLRLGAQTRRAWYQAVAAAQTAQYMEQVRESADAGAELARRMVQAGNWPRINQLREHAFYAEAAAQLGRSRQAAAAERERLARLLGLQNVSSLKLPERLPDLPGSARELQNVEAQALEQRLDVLSARRQTEMLASALGLSRATRFINVLEIGPARVTESPDPRKKGFELELQVPLFDWGTSRVARAEATYMQAVNRVAEVAVNARSQVRESYFDYRTAFDLARHYRDEVVPLRKQISDETLLRYNGMLASVFELLADSRDQVASVTQYLDALRAFWLADANLQTALTAGAPESSPPGTAARVAPTGVGEAH